MKKKFKFWLSTLCFKINLIYFIWFYSFMFIINYRIDFIEWIRNVSILFDDSFIWVIDEGSFEHLSSLTYEFGSFDLSGSISRCCLAFANKAFVRNWIKYWLKASLKISGILGEKIFRVSSDFGRNYPSKFLRFWKKISFKISPLLGESIPQIFSDFERK